MTYQTTIGWSIFTSGIITLVLEAIPIHSIWLGVVLTLVGVVVLYVRRDDLLDAI